MIEGWVNIGLIVTGLIILLLSTGDALDDPPDFPNNEDYYE